MSTNGAKVLHLHKVAGISGSEAHLLSLLPRLAERGWDVRMLAGRASPVRSARRGS